MIADPAEEFRSTLTQMLQDKYQVCSCQDGTEALDLLRSYVPDILVLDLMMPGLDGISLLQQAAEAELTPMVLATTRFLNNYVTEALDKLGVGYVMVKPCDMRATVKRIEDLSEHLRRPVSTQSDYRAAAANLLLKLGVPAKLRGYSCLREAVPLLRKDPSQAITKELYPAVAEICGGDGPQVERAIRNAIKAAWEKRDDTVWQNYFLPNSDGFIPRPTNGEFIYRLGEHLAQEL